MSSTRVLATCAVLGQAVGTAAAVAIKNNLSPKEVYKTKLNELKVQLMDDDAYLPWNKRDMWTLSKKAIISTQDGNADLIKNGVDRNFGEELNSWIGNIGSYVEYSFDKPEKVNEMRFVFDSDLNRETCSDKWWCKSSLMNHNTPVTEEEIKFPQTLIKAFKIEAKDSNGEFKTVYENANNHNRLVKLNLNIETTAVRFIGLETWGIDKINLFSWDMR